MQCSSHWPVLHRPPILAEPQLPPQPPVRASWTPASCHPSGRHSDHPPQSHLMGRSHVILGLSLLLENLCECSTLPCHSPGMATNRAGKDCWVKGTLASSSVPPGQLRDLVKPCPLPNYFTFTLQTLPQRTGRPTKTSHLRPGTGLPIRCLFRFPCHLTATKVCPGPTGLEGAGYAKQAPPR